ncbi:sugar transferase [Enterococcus gallinarum]|uniref:Sugar transferase n=1 Tax=Enterococcus gallinarum TaxID=1353 RepID=A0ABD4ZPT1_ENTGA|nr:sugar transferase [Enterococcus gallinarum]MDL4874032.1 sugar transferase [Enterococcus gallinarum]MDL4881418.1 sugar transferase [Enterococcus gallinarum]MDL4884965.1 sugar transferase [Enterococcus gallinarum]MDL4893695.1 sugar transferase [Enterococcus gallinarum]MDL4919618.1 sugar transferase [Enterococcus gallinarum]
MQNKGIYELIFKRILDIILAIIALIILSPIYIVLALLIRIKLGSPIIFKQIRPGKNEKMFSMYKFRTMSNHKDAFGNLLSDEERLTNFGKTIRSLSLDEIPEFWNIIKGDMSIIGPRPLLKEYLSLYNSEQRRRHSVRPGLTGLAQVKGRNSISWKEKFEYDCQYIDNITFLGDLRIFLLTIKKVLVREGITSDTHVTNEKFEGNE